MCLRVDGGSLGKSMARTFLGSVKMRAPQAPAGAGAGGGGCGLWPPLLVSGRFAEQAWVCPPAHCQAVAAFWKAEADEVPSFQAGDEREQVRLLVDPDFIFVAHFIPGAVAPDDEGIEP